MKYPYLILLNIVSISLTLFTGAVIFYLLARIGQKLKFMQVLMVFGIFEVCSFLLYLVFPITLLSRMPGIQSTVLFHALTFISIIFFIFQFVTKKFLSFNLQKSLLVFSFLVFIIFPTLCFGRNVFMTNISKISVFASESTQLQAEMNQYIETYGFGGFINPYAPAPPEQLPFKIIGMIEKGTLAWPTDNVQKILFVYSRRN